MVYIADNGLSFFRIKEAGVLVLYMEPSSSVNH